MEKEDREWLFTVPQDARVSGSGWNDQAMFKTNKKLFLLKRFFAQCIITFGTYRCKISWSLKGMCSERHETNLLKEAASDPALLGLITRGFQEEGPSGCTPFLTVLLNYPSQDIIRERLG